MEKAMKKPVLVIMAAGMGSRFGGLKQIEPVGSEGEIILDFSMYDAMMAGFEKAVLKKKKENEEAFRSLIDRRAGRFLEVEYAFQELADLPEGYDVPAGREKPWGTGGPCRPPCRPLWRICPCLMPLPIWIPSFPKWISSSAP